MARKRVSPVSPLPDLDARKAAILRAVVEEHIDTAQPVGSGSVASNQQVTVSPATVRSEMVALEREGFLAQPHTSAGRIPTDRGYRYFVDHLNSGVLSGAQQRTLKEFFSSIRGEMETVLEQTSTLLSRMTNYTAVVVGPGHERATVRSAQLVDLGPRRVLVVAILSDGAVEKRTLELDHEVTPAEVVEASSQLNALLIGTALGDRLEVPSRDARVPELVRRAASSLFDDDPLFDDDRVFIGGSARVAESFEAVETVREVLGVLEQVARRRVVSPGHPRSGSLGGYRSRNGLRALSACAVVVAPVTIDGTPAGAVGLLGPTRMNYGEALAAARAVSQQLSQRYGAEGLGGTRG
jgi:heat-inducible transcriptional repressor